MPSELLRIARFGTDAPWRAVWLRFVVSLAIVAAIFAIIPHTPLDGPIGGVIALSLALVCCWSGGPYAAACVPLLIVVISRATHGTPLFSLPTGPETMTFLTLSVVTTAVGLAGQYQRRWRQASLQHERDRKHAEASLRASEERYRMLADHMAQLAWTCDSLGNATWYNQRWLDYTGLSFQEMQGTGWIKVQHPDHVERVMASIQRAVETAEPWEDTFPLRCHDGSYRWFLSRAVPIRNDAGEIVCWFGTNTDVTEQRAAEEALKEAHRRKDEFLAMLAHELRGPLAPLCNMLEVMKRADGAGDLLRQSRDTMERQLGQMVRLVDDLLDVSRISRGRIELKRQRVELASVVYQAVEANCPLAESAQQEVTVTLPAAPIHVCGDPVRLTQVFGNLLNNACKYTPPGGKIWLTAERQGSDVVVRVRDTGVGISSEKLSSVFEMFSQVESSLERSQGGLGIGLSLVRRLVEMHEGSVEVQSDGPGCGSEFVVRLPVLIENLSAGPPLASEPVPERLMTHRRVLVVDDNRDSATSLALLLRMTGNDTRTAHDGLQAIEQAEAYQPAVILLDIGLPKLNGYDACRRIREQPWGQDIVILALTGWGQPDDRRKSQEAGFNGHLTKPVDIAALTALLTDSPEANSTALAGSEQDSRDRR